MPELEIEPQEPTWQELPMTQRFPEVRYYLIGIACAYGTAVLFLLVPVVTHTYNVPMRGGGVPALNAGVIAAAVAAILGVAATYAMLWAYARRCSWNNAFLVDLSPVDDTVATAFYVASVVGFPFYGISLVHRAIIRRRRAT